MCFYVLSKSRIPVVIRSIDVKSCATDACFASDLALLPRLGQTEDARVVSMLWDGACEDLGLSC